MTELDNDISELIVLEILGNLNTQEQEKLTQWRSISAENEAFYQRIKDESNIEKYLYESSKFSSELGWEKFSRSILIVRRKKILQITLKYAAILIVPLLISTLVISSYFDSQQDSLGVFANSADNSTSPILVLADGQLMNLDSIKDISIQEENGILIKTENNIIDYFTGKASVKKNIFKKKELINMISIPRGGEYKLLLSDGTMVFLNSMSSVIYPVVFSGDKRKIKLKGEAYFDVAKGSSPFIVEVNSMEVEALGTKFNINAYNEKEYYTTLVEGSVRIKTPEYQAILSPSEQARVVLGSTTIIVKEVETNLYTSWIEGKISFKDVRLEEIFNSMSKWYQMSVIYEDESLKNIRFGCNVDKYSDLSSFIKILEETKSIDIEISEDNTITIKKASKR